MIAALQGLMARRARALPPRLRIGLLVVAAVGVLIASVWAWRSTGLEVGDLDPVPLVIAFVVAAPASLLLKAAEYHVAARVVGQRPTHGDALDVAVVSSAANLLPIPGSLLVTVRSLASEGATYGGAVAASAVPGLAWLGLTGMAGGVAIAVAGPTVLGLAVAGAGVVAGLAAIRVFDATAPAEGRMPLIGAILAVEAGWLAVSAFRLGLMVAALGEPVDLAQALALSVAGAITVAIGFFPGGLGIREALIAAISPLVGLPLETGVLVGSIDRVVWLAFLGLASAVLAATRARGRAPVR